MADLRKSSVRVALLVAIVAYSPLNAQDEKTPVSLKAPLSAEVEFRQVNGASGQIPAGSPFGVEVRLINHAGTEPPAGLTLFGWLRRQDPSNLPCAKAAESFMRTGRLPVGSVFLNDPIIVSVTQDDALLMIDPEFSLVTANILAANRLPGRPAALVADPDARRVLLPLPEQGQLLAVDSSGQLSTVGSGLGKPVMAVPAADGAVYVLDAKSQRLTRVPAGNVPALTVSGLRGAVGAPVAAAWGPDGAVLFDTSNGTELLSTTGRTDVAAPLVSDETAFGLVVVRGRSLAIHYLDAPQAPPITVSLAARVRAIEASRDGRVLLAYDPAGGPVSVIDVARSRLVQVTKAGETAISEVIISDRAAYLMLADQTRLGVLDLTGLTRDQPAEFREVLLGAARDDPLTGAGLMTSLWPDAGILAVHANSRQGFKIEDYAAMGNAPAMTAAPLRGGVPRLVASIDRSFQEKPRGFFKTMAVLPGPGRWELVATTGLSGLSFCASVPVSDSGTPAKKAQLLQAVLMPESRALRLRLIDGSGKPVQAAGLLTFAEMSGAWRDSAAIRTGVDGLSHRVYELPERGSIVITLSTHDRREVQPLVLEDLQ